MGHTRWDDLSTRKQKAILLGGAAQVALLGAALLDLRRRPATELNGPKPLWIALSFVNFLGPIAYFLVGRNRRAE